MTIRTQLRRTVHLHGHDGVVVAHHDQLRHFLRGHFFDNSLELCSVVVVQTTAAEYNVFELVTCERVAQFDQQRDTHFLLKSAAAFVLPKLDEEAAPPVRLHRN